MGKKLYNEDYINQIALEIQKKSGTHDRFQLQDFAERVSKLGEPPEKDVNFYDYDGKRLYSYTTAEALVLTSMPDLPDHTDINLTSDGWNWTLAELKSMQDPFVNIGATYHPTDNKTHIKLNIWTPCTFTIRVRSTVANGGTIDWGDGSELTTITNTGISSSTYSHVYSTAGIYDVTVAAIDNSGIEFGSNFVDPTTDNNSMYKSMLTSVVFAKNVRLYGWCFSGAVNTEIVVFNKDVYFNDSTTMAPINDNRWIDKVKAVIIPKGMKLHGNCDFRGVRTSIVSIPLLLEFKANDNFYETFLYYNGRNGLCTAELKNNMGAALYGGDYNKHRTRIDIFYRNYLWAAGAWTSRSSAAQLKDVYLQKCIAIPKWDRNQANLSGVTLHVPRIMYDDMMEWAYWNGTAEYEPDRFKGTIVPYDSEWQTHYERVFSLANDTVIAGLAIDRFGNESEDANYDTTDFLEVTPGETLYCINEPYSTFNIYDSEKTWISGGDFSWLTMNQENMGYILGVMPSNAAYIRFSSNKDNSGWHRLEGMNVWRRLD